MRAPIAALVSIVAGTAVALAACGSGSSTSGGPGSSGSSGSSGADCTTVECVRAVKCRKTDCSGAVLNNGCCGCPSGYVDELTCSTGGDAAAQKADCAPACAASEICIRPNSCSFDAHCVAAAEVTCPDAGLCGTTGCAGELHGASLDCVCR